MAGHWERPANDPVFATWAHVELGAGTGKVRTNEDPMQRYLTIGLALMLAAPVACGGGDRQQKDSAESTRQVQAEFAIPDWAINIPAEPGNAFYGVGVGTFKSPALMQNGFQQADTAARRQIADTMEVTIQAATMRYMRQIVTELGEVAEEALAQDVSRSVTNTKLSGVEIVKRASVFDERSGLYIVYSLARIAFDSVAETMHREMAQRVEKVRQNAENAFADLDRLLAGEQTDRAPKEPVYDQTVPEVVKPR